MSAVPVVMVLVSALAGPGQDERYERALGLADAGRPAEAAVEFEALAASGDASSHFEAGQMRFAAGHMAHAYRHFERHLASGLNEDSRSITQSRLVKAGAGTRVVELRLRPVTRATVIVRRLGDPPASQRPDLEAPVTAGTTAIRLDPGDWELRVEAPGYLPLRRVLAVGDAGAQVELALVPVPAAVPGASGGPRRARGETVAGAVLVPLGVVALGGFVATTVVYGKIRAQEEKLGADCNDRDVLLDLRRQARRDIGAMVGLGVASAALLTAGAVLLVRGRQTLRRPRLALDIDPGRAGLTLSGNF